jgi:NADPH:quinone reductase-like Zn-dependent oxidoreductase
MVAPTHYYVGWLPSHLIVQANASQLAEISALIDSNELRVFVEDVFPFAKARDAYLRAQQGGMRGKIALSIPDAK